MAAITFAATTGGSGFRRAGVAQANTGQTDWLRVPSWATFLDIILDITAVAGTTPIVTPDLVTADPITADDANIVSLVVDAGTGFTTPPTAAGTHRILAGPGITGIANDVALAATGDSTAYINTVLPPILGVKLALDRTTGDETYTYTLNVRFCPR